MLTSLAFIFLLGLAGAAICKQLRLPRIIGMLFTGVLLGPCVLGLLDPSILGISADLRKMALVIILIKAGLSLDLSSLRSVGRPALLLSFLPALLEICGLLLLGPRLLGIRLIEAAILGAVLGAVSPAVVVPQMVHLMETGYGTDKNIPQLILAGASLDDVFVIVLFSCFIGMAQGNSKGLLSLGAIPISILAGILLGVIAGLGLAYFFDAAYSRRRLVRNSTKSILLLGMAFLLLAAEDWLEGYLPLSGLLAVMSMACALRLRCIPAVGNRLSEKFGKLWLAAEVILFVLVGAAVDIRYAFQAGPMVLLVILLALLFRSAGTVLSLWGTNLSFQERLFCVIAYLPKATVQAAIGGIPLALGLPCGKLILSAAVLSILITAPLGAWGMEATYRRLLRHEPIASN